MGTRLVMIGVLAAGLSGRVCADSVSVGYSPVPLQREYTQTDLKTGDEAKKETTYGAGTLQILYTVEKKARDTINLTLTTGIGMPLGSVKFLNTTEVTGAQATDSRNATNEGDSEEISAYTLPALVGAKYIIPMGDNAMTIGVSVGALFIGTQAKMTDVTWTGPVASEKKSTTAVTYKSSVAPAFAGFVTLGYNVKMGEGESIGITIPLGLISSVRQDTESTRETVPPAPPSLLKTTDDGWKAGGFGYGIQVGWNKSF